MALTIQYFIFYFSSVPLVVACVVGVVRYRQLDVPQRYLLWLSLLITIASLALAHYKHPNLVLVPIDTAIEFTLLALIYRHALRPTVIARY